MLPVLLFIIQISIDVHRSPNSTNKYIIFFFFFNLRTIVIIILLNVIESGAIAWTAGILQGFEV